MLRFVFAPIVPVIFLTAASFVGGWWSVAALLSVSVLVIGVDRLLPPPASRTENRSAETGRLISMSLAIAHLVLLPLGVWAVTANPALSGPAALATVFALALFVGQVSNANAHELIHHPTRLGRWLGVAVFSSLLFGHHASAHTRVHHRFVATPDDPNSAPLGMGFYRFWPRAWFGSFRSGFAADTRLRRKNPARTGLHPYAIYIAGAVLSLWISYSISGLAGFGTWIGLSLYAQMQLLLSDYVQHYGLTRAKTAAGIWEPTGPQHSWNAPHWYSSALMLNAPRHSDHHTNPSRGFPDLRLDRETMPELPHSLPVMGAIALIPPLWRRIMDKRAAKWATAAPDIGGA